jgi:hypothetical protein
VFGLGGDDPTFRRTDTATKPDDGRLGFANVTLGTIGGEASILHLVMGGD